MCDLDSSRSSSGAGGDSDVADTTCPHVTAIKPAQHYGSFYLRMGAVAFGIGSMIYSGLEFGQYFELEQNTKCHNIMLALTPATRMAFIFIQMYFIFLNNEVSIFLQISKLYSGLTLVSLITMRSTADPVWKYIIRDVLFFTVSFIFKESQKRCLYVHNS